MFTIILIKFEERNCNNYPKYTIIIKNTGTYYFTNGSAFYYLISFNKYATSNPNKNPQYLIALDLYIDRYKESEKFNLSKLGTDYIFNKINMHLKKECTDIYPDNYVFVNEPKWPSMLKNSIDRSPLKGRA